MAGKKKPVDRTPICDPACFRRIDPVWMPGPVPPRFWEDRTHRRDYLLWSAHRFGLRTMEDLYRLELKACYRRNHGGGVNMYWGGLALDAVLDCFPEYDWKPWLFTMLPQLFWDSPSNRRSYMDWLGQRLGNRCMDDWYEVTMYDFLQNRGSGLMLYYHGSPALAVIGSIPARSWCEWKFRHVPPGFWAVAENRHRYLRWVGKELGFRRPEDWYRIRAEEIVRRHGDALRRRYASFYDLMREFLPQLDWDRRDKHQPIRIEAVLAWADAFHATYARWPTTRSGEISGTSHTWRRIDRALRDGFRGMSGGISLASLLEKHRGVRFGQTSPPLTEQQILAWADAYHAAQGKWPTKNSRPIPGTTETWSAVVAAMRSGCRGLRRGSSLARLLAQRRGVLKRLNYPPLEERQILAWALAHFKATGRWPTQTSGPIAQSPGVTWTAVNQALRRGGRGLPGGSSLPKLLQKHGMK